MAAIFTFPKLLIESLANVGVHVWFLNESYRLFLYEIPRLLNGIAKTLPDANIIADIRHEHGAHRLYEILSLIDSPFSFIRLNRVAFVIGDQAHFLNLVECPPIFYRNHRSLNQVKAAGTIAVLTK